MTDIGTDQAGQDGRAADQRPRTHSHAAEAGQTSARGSPSQTLVMPSANTENLDGGAGGEDDWELTSSCGGDTRRTASLAEVAGAVDIEAGRTGMVILMKRRDRSVE